MSGVLLILLGIVIFVVAYMTYGKFLAKSWGIDPSRTTPAHTLEDGVDYCPAKTPVLMGHHFSSIAGAGPINGPIQAAYFGWVPCFLWIVIGGIFFGGLQDFGSLFASIRHDGKSVGEIIEDSMGSRAKKLFIIFALLVLILVIASFVNIVAGTFLTLADDAGKTAFGFVTNPTGNQSTAMISLLFIVLAVIYGYVTNRMGVKTLPATIGGIICIVAAIAGDASQDLKTGFIVGATPKLQQIGEMVGVIASSAAIGYVLYLLNAAWGFGSNEIPAPQATMMKMLVEGIMNAELPWGLILIGVFIAIVVEIIKVPVMPFAVGMYLPFSLSAGIMAGGAVRFLVEKIKGTDEEKKARTDKGVLFTSGLIAGEGITGILLAGFAVAKLDVALKFSLPQVGSLIIFIALLGGLFALCMKAKPAKK